MHTRSFPPSRTGFTHYRNDFCFVNESKRPTLRCNSQNYVLETAKYYRKLTPQTIILVYRAISQVGKSKYYDIKGKQGETHGRDKGDIGG